MTDFFSVMLTSFNPSLPQIKSVEEAIAVFVICSIISCSVLALFLCALLIILGVPQLIKSNKTKK